MVRFNTAQFDPFLRSSIGFDQLFRELDRVTDGKVTNYPPYNIVKVSEDSYRIEVAVSGFSEDELSVELKDNVLTVTGDKEETESQEYLYKGIGARGFERKFTLAADLVVKQADINNGILSIDMELVIPEHKKPRKIAIGKSTTISEKELLVE